MTSVRRWCVVAWSTAAVIGAARAAPGQATAAPLPTPTGQYPVGTAVAHLTDSSRALRHATGGRPIALQVWYPASARADAGNPAPYLMEPSLVTVLLQQQYYGVDSASLQAWTQLTTHARLDAPIARGRHPLVTLSVGLGVARANYTSIAEEFASHGYIVAAVENPLAGIMLLPDGRIIQDTTADLNDPAQLRAEVESWSHDITFVLDHLAANQIPEAAVLRDAVDWKRIGAMGHSIGGLVAIATCQRDARVRACIDMDGGFATPDQQPMAEFVTAALIRPTLVLNSKPIYSDADFARRGITREEWLKRGGGTAAFDSLVARSRVQMHVASVAGTGHFSFSDAPFVMPTTITRFGGRIIDGRRGWQIITTTSRAFFDMYLGRTAGSFPGTLNQTFPELVVKP